MIALRNIADAIYTAVCDLAVQPVELRGGGVVYCILGTIAQL